MQFLKIFFLNRPEDGVAPADLSLLTPPGDADFGPCRLSSPPISERRRVLPSHMFKTPQRHTPVRVEEGINLPEFGARQTSNCYFFLCRSRLQQGVSVKSGECRAANTTSPKDTAGSATTFQKGTLITGNSV